MEQKTSRASRLVVLGSVNMDLVAAAPRRPDAGETILGTAFHATSGGKGANQAVAAARLGAKAYFIGRVGRDTFGQQLADGLSTNGVDIQGLAVDEAATTGIAHIRVTPDGQNDIVVVSGANGGCGKAELDQLDRLLVPGCALLLQMEVPVEVSVEAARRARGAGGIVVFDPAPAGPIPEDAYSSFTVLTPNETEAAALTGVNVQDEGSARRAARILLERGADSVVVKMGPHGALYASPGEEGLALPFSVTAVDAVGAGDAFNAAMALHLVQGASLAEAVRWGAAAGALAATRPGAQEAIPTFQAVQALASSGVPSTRV